MYDEKLNSIIRKLELYFPEGKVFALDSIDKHLRETISLYAKSKGFYDTNSFLNSIGYESIKGEDVKSLRTSVVYEPGNEPDFIRNKVINICNRLDEYYPNKEIERGIQNDHKALASSISGMYQWLGYSDTKDFLEAYGYKYNLESTVGGRPSNDYSKVLDYLINKYSANPIYTSVKELLENEKEIAGNLKTINNKSNELFGMTFKAYLEENNILLKVEKEVVEKKTKVEIFDRIREYLSNEFVNMEYDLDELIAKYRNFKLEYREKEKSVYVKELLEKNNYVEIPYGVTAISASFYETLDGVEILKICETVKRVDFESLKKISSLKQVVLVNPKFKLKKEFFEGLDIVVDNSKIIKNYIEENSIADQNKINLINYINQCFKIGNYNISFFLLDWSNKLVFNVSKNLYKTDINISDVKFVDDVLEKIFNFEWVCGFTGSWCSHYKKINVKICEGENSNEN